MPGKNTEVVELSIKDVKLYNICNFTLQNYVHYTKFTMISKYLHSPLGKKLEKETGME